MSGASPTPYEKLWENLSHKESNTPLEALKLTQSVDRTTQEAEFPGTRYWADFHQGQIVNPSRAEDNIVFQGTKLPQSVGGTAQIKEDVRSPYWFYTPVTPPSDVDVVLAHAETGTHYWQELHRQIVNPSAKEDVRSPSSFYTSVTSLSDLSDVTDFTQFRKYQIGKQKLEISEQFDILSQREDNWDGRGSQKPTDLTLAYAKEVIGTLLDSVIFAGHRCDTPSISSDGDGNVTAAWYKDERQLHLQIGEHEAEYFRVWGTNIDTEMDVDFLKPDSYLTLWEWLIDNLPFPPDIGATLHGNVTAAWYKDKRQLHSQIGEHEAECFKVSGTNIDTEMDVDFLKPDKLSNALEMVN